MLKPLIPRSQLSLLSPFRLFPQAKAPRILRPLLLSSLRKGSRQSQGNRPFRLAAVLFLFLCFFFLLNIGIIVMRFLD